MSQIQIKNFWLSSYLKHRNTVLVEAHYKLGHQGATCTYCLIKHQYYWKGMNKDIRKYIAHYTPCHREKAKVQAYPLQMTEIPEWPFHKIAIDLVTECENSSSCNKHILTIINHLTGWLEAFPIPDKSADTIISTFISCYLPVHMCPRYILLGQWQWIQESPKGSSTSTTWHWSHFFHTLPPSKQWKTRSLPQVSKTCTQETLWKGSIKLGQMHLSSAHKLQSNTQPCHSRNTTFPHLWERPKPTITRTSGTDTMIPRRSRIWLTEPGSTSSSPSYCKETLDENCFKTAQKTTDGEPPSFKIGDRVYFKNKQPGKWDLKWRPGYRIVHNECDGHYLHIENQATVKTRSCNVKDVVLEPPVELWNIDTQFGRTGKYINHPANLPTTMLTDWRWTPHSCT